MSREHIPPRPSGSERESRFMQSVHDKTHGQSEKIIDSDTIKVRRSTRGISLHAKVQKKGSTTSGGMNYRGTYVSTETYSKYDVVRVMTGNSQGVWICVSEEPIGEANPPVWPEPATLTPPQANKWELLAFGVQVTTVCSNGNKLVYTNATPPI